ncbi:MAG: glycoside hydrolase family 127 protein [FCB group bacterium]|jgi:DUF1680 family protein|nr:glycoside hydrolase family 127 protein [FCB group bacterium]
MGTLLGFVLCGLAATDAASADWWNSGWQVRQRVYLDASVLEEDLENFPVRAILSPEAGARDGIDIWPIHADGSGLPFEVVRCDRDGVEVYVRVPRIVAGRAGQYFDLYYGMPNSGSNPAVPVWLEPHRLVQHFNNNFADAMGHADAVSVEGGVGVSPAGAEFIADPGFLNVAPALLEGMGDGITISVRFRVHGGPQLQTLASGLRKEPKDWFNFGLKTPEIVHTNAVSNGKEAPELNVTAIRPDEWHSAVIRYDAAKHTRTICVDGVAFQQDASLPGPLRIEELRIGRGVLHFEPWQFQGTIDEVRVAATARSDSWMRAEAGSLGDAGAFCIVGPPQRINEPMPKPQPFALLEPADGIEWRKRAGVVLRWHPSAGAESYTVRTYAGKGETQPLQEYDAGGATRFELPFDAARHGEMYWTVTAKSAQGNTNAHTTRRISFYDWSQPAGELPKQAVAPTFRSIPTAEIELQGYLRERIDRIVKNWFQIVPESSPAILQVFRDRDRRPVREPLMPWAGEFAGKFLTSGELNWRVTRDPELRKTLDAFARDLIACQAENGYLGPFPAEARLTGGNWDVWGHYHCMLGLLLYYEDTQDEFALTACRKMGDLLFETFGPGGPSMTCDGSQGQMNMAVCHGLLLLYEKTGVERYRQLAEYIVHDAWNEPNAGQYLKAALEGKEVWDFPAHRWEALHDYQALPLLYWLTGNQDYRVATERIWRSCVKGDRHNTGGFSSGEGCTGSPYNLGAIETCCTVAWAALSVDMLRLTGESGVADELEWSTLNSALGAVPYSGRGCAYNVPMDGVRTFGVELHWQAPKAGPDLNCCSVNAPRPFGMLADWAVMAAPDGLALNFYGPSRIVAPLPTGHLTIVQETDYPANGHIKLTVSAERPATLNLRLRIPRWSKQTELKVNGEMLPMPVPGTYAEIKREWFEGDVIELTLDFGLRFWVGDEEVAGKVSVFRGPIVFAYDARYNDINPDQLPALDPAKVRIALEPAYGPLPAWLQGTLTCGDATVKVCDVSSAGQTGNQYVTWFPAVNVGPGAKDGAWPFGE